MRKILLVGVISVTAWIILCGYTNLSELNITCTYENLYSKIKQLDIKNPKVVNAQILLESNHLKSNLFKSNNNLMGMKHPKVRPTTSLGSKNGYAYYSDWISCLEDYKLYQEFIFSKRGNMSRKQYLIYINKHYAEDPLYSNKIEKLISSNLDLTDNIDSLIENEL